MTRKEPNSTDKSADLLQKKYTPPKIRQKLGMSAIRRFQCRAASYILFGHILVHLAPP